MLSRKKVRKYFLYAFGEIVLVVIGILIALQLNSLKEENKRRNSELKFYVELKNDLLANKSEIENQLAWEWKDVRIPLADSLYNQLYKATVDLKTINYLIGNQIMAYRTFNNANSSYAYMASEGYSFIKNESIRVSTTDLYETDFNNINYNLKLYESLINEDLKPLIFKYGELNANHEFEVLNLMGLKTDQYFKNNLNNYRYHLKLNYPVFQRALHKLNHLIHEINAELIREGVEVVKEPIIENRIIAKVVGDYHANDDYIHVFEDDGQTFFQNRYPYLQRKALKHEEGYQFVHNENEYNFKPNTSKTVDELIILFKKNNKQFSFMKFNSKH